MLLADVPAERARERAESARMGAVELSVAADVGVRPAQDRGDVALIHPSRDDTLVGPRGLRFRDERHECRGRIGAPHRRDLADVLAHVRLVQRVVAEDEILRRSDLPQDELRLRAIVEVALRVQHRERRLPHRPRIDVRGDVDAGASRTIERRDQARPLTPERPHGELHVRHLHGHVRHTADREQLVERLPEVAVLTPHVADVPPAHGADVLRDLQYFVPAREDSGVVLESRRQTERPSRHLLAHERAHAPDFVRRRDALEIVAHHARPDHPMSHIGRDIDRGRLRVDARENRGERILRPAILPGHDRRDTLRYHGQRFAVRREAAVVVAVRVDESGRERQSLRVDDAITRDARQRADGIDPSVHDAHVGDARR